jgi:hypothetical protein
MKKITFCLSFIIQIATCLSTISQTKHFTKVEVTSLRFQNRTLTVDPGPNWKGYNLDNGQNGLELCLQKGIQSRDRFFAGLGAGYLNFEGINGLSLFADLALVWPTNKKVSPFIAIKPGYSHIWNQYQGGRGTGSIETGAGLRLNLANGNICNSNLA